MMVILTMQIVMINKMFVILNDIDHDDDHDNDQLIMVECVLTSQQFDQTVPTWKVNIQLVKCKTKFNNGKRPKKMISLCNIPFVGRFHFFLARSVHPV